MGYPIDVGTISLYRGDTRTLPFDFFGAPPAWASATDYVVGEVGSATYVANSTVSVQGKRYTCISAHTSGSMFEADLGAGKWSLDADAVGTPSDLTAFGSEVTCSLRKKQDDVLVATVDTSATDLANGSLVMAITADNWNDMAGFRSLGFDIEVATPDRLSVTTLVVGMFEISKDYTYDSYGS